MKPLTLHPHEIRRLLSTGSVTVWRPVNRRSCASVPTWLWNRLEWDDAKVPTGAMGTCADNGYLHIACRPVEGDSPDEWTRERVYPAHPPGSERWVRETWGYYCDYENLYDCIRYKTDGACKKPEFHRFANVSENTWYRFAMLCDGCGCKDHSWRSPVTMPRWASRLSVTSTAVQARQVQSITEDEAVEAGLSDLTAFSEWWQRRFDTLGPNPWAWATTLERKKR